MTDTAQTSKAGYDPYAHRVVDHPLTNSEAFLHLIKGSLGVGIIAMPLAFKYAGYLSGFFFALLFGAMVLSAMHILFNSMYDLCKRKQMPYLTYAEAMDAALELGPPSLRGFTGCGSCFVNTTLGLYSFGMGCVYVVFIAESMKDIAKETKAGTYDLRFYILGTAVPLVIVYSIIGLKRLMVLTVVANFLYIAALIILGYYIIIFDDSKTTRKSFGDWENLPLNYGIVLFAIEAIGIILAIEEHMAKPKDYLGTCGIMNAGMVIVFICNVTMGFMGYWKYGDAVNGSITLNMPRDDILVYVTKVGFAFSILISYALQGYVTVDLTWTHLFKVYTAEYNYARYEFTLRLFITILTVFCAMLLPKFSQSMVLVGVFCLSILGLILPALMDICVRYPDRYGRLKFIIFRDIFIIVFGLVGGVLGTWTSGRHIFTTLFEDDDYSDEYKK